MPPAELILQATFKDDHGWHTLSLTIKRDAERKSRWLVETAPDTGRYTNFDVWWQDALAVATTRLRKAIEGKVGL